jgi:hypothetical protein
MYVNERATATGLTGKQQEAKRQPDTPPQVALESAIRDAATPGMGRQVRCIEDCRLSPIVSLMKT